MARINDPLIDVLTRHQVLIERIKAGYSANYTTKIVPALDRAIRDVLSALDTDGPMNVEFSVEELNRVLARLNTRQQKIYEEFIKDFMVQNQEFAGDEASFESKVLTANVVSAKIADIATPTARTAFKLAEAMPIRATGQLLEPFVRDWSLKEIQAVEGVVRNAFYNGLTNREMLTAVRGTKAKNFTDGYLSANNSHAKTTVNTAVQHVANTARLATWEANDDIVDGYTIIATLDGKTSAICRSLDHKSFYLGKGPVPPLHPNCRSTTIPRIKAEYRKSDAQGTRSSKGGYVPGNTTYYEWLKGESKQFQDIALGPQRAKLFRDGGISATRFAQLNLGRNFEPLTLAEMRKIDPTAFKRAGL